MNRGFEEVLTKCETYKNNNTEVYFYDIYKDEDINKFKKLQQKKLCVKKNKKDKIGIFYKHRILYKTIFNEELKNEILTIIMFNPSTADHYSNDPTINNCITIADDNKYGGIEIINMLTIRNPDINSAMDNKENHIESFSLYTSYLKNKKILLAWGGTSNLNTENKRKKFELQRSFLNVLETIDGAIFYTYSDKLVENRFPRHPSPQSFNMIRKNSDGKLKQVKIHESKIEYA